MAVAEKRANTKADKLEGQYDEETIAIRRTAKVVKGGRIFRFSALVVVGDGKGRVGIGIGSAREVPDAIKKAIETARKSMIKVRLKGSTIHHEIVAYHGATKVFMKPASEGTGVIAGGAMRKVLEVLGVQNILAKCFGSTNAINVARATIKGLASMKTPDYIAEKRGKTVAELFSEGEASNG